MNGVARSAIPVESCAKRMTRPDPDQLLAHVQAEEARAKRGRLRIFFGASAGVGKTYAMLEAARTVCAPKLSRAPAPASAAVRAASVSPQIAQVAAAAPCPDVVVGYVEPHGRVDTERLLEGLEILPTLSVKYRGIVRK